MKANKRYERLVQEDARRRTRANGIAHPDFILAANEYLEDKQRRNRARSVRSAGRVKRDLALWSPQQIVILQRFYNGDVQMTIAALAKVIGKSRSAIYTKARDLGLQGKGRRTVVDNQ